MALTAEERKARVARGHRRREDAEKLRGKLGILIDGSYVFWNPAHTGYCYCRIEHGVETEVAECIPKTALDPYARVVFIREGPALVAFDPNSLDAVNIYGESAPALVVPSQPMGNRGSGDWTPTAGNLLLGNGSQFNSTPFLDAFEEWVGYLRSGAAVARQISGGVLTVGEEAVVVVSAETGVTDTLNTLVASGAARLLLLIAASGHTITINPGTATNLFTFGGGTVAFEDTDVLLVYWNETGGFASGGAGGSSPLTTKGDLYGFDTAPARIPAGADGQILVYDSTQSLGVRATNLPGSSGGGTVDGVLPTICEGRLTLTSGTPVTVTDVTGAGTLYFDSYKGDVIALFDGSSVWTGFIFSELSLSLAGLLPHSIHDVFCYDASGSPALELLAWNAGASGAITNVTNANPPVVTSNGHGLSVDDIVTISGVVGATGVNSTFRVSAVTANTFTLVTLAGANPGAPGAYVSGGNWYQANYVGSRATALALQDGVEIKSGDSTRRYLGTIRITATAGQTEDSRQRRLVWNRANAVERELRYTPGGTSHNYTTQVWRAWANSLVYRVEFVIGIAEQPIHLLFNCVSATTGGAARNGGIGLDSITVNASTAWGGISAGIVTITVPYHGLPSAGYHYAQWLEVSQVSGTTTWYDFPGFTPEMWHSEMTGWITA